MGGRTVVYIAKVCLEVAQCTKGLCKVNRDYGMSEGTVQCKKGLHNLRKDYKI